MILRFEVHFLTIRFTDLRRVKIINRYKTINYEV